MNACFESLQQARLAVLEELLGPRARASRPRGKPTRELIGVTFEIRNPRHRLVHRRGRPWSLPFALGEFLWYMRGDRTLAALSYYCGRLRQFSDDGTTLHSAYGARLFGRHPLVSVNQWRYVTELLRRDPDSRQAILHIRTVQDSQIPSADHPCTLALQFLARDGRLHLVVTMRSNDVTLGTCYDIFCFTLMQEVMAAELGLQLGHYYHQVGSLHLYEQDMEDARLTLQSSIMPSPMPPMPGGGDGLAGMIAEEEAIRRAVTEDRMASFRPAELPDRFWRDWQLILMCYGGRPVDVARISDCYPPVFDPRYRRGERQASSVGSEPKR